MDKIELLSQEYNNLFQEKLIHKQSLRKLKGYISYLTSIVSLSLAFMGISTTDIFKGALNAKTFSDIFILISIPFTPIVTLVSSFAINDLFQIYVIGTQTGMIEKKLNALVNEEKLLTWEHHICPVVYGERSVADIEPIKNVINQSDFRIFFPFVYILIVSTLFLGGKFIACNNIYLYVGYTVINVYFLASFLWIGLKLNKYIKTDNLTNILNALNKAEDKQENSIT